jgi:hypothetical protein
MYGNQLASAYDLEGLGLADLPEDDLMGVLGEVKRMKNKYPSISDGHAAQIAARRRKLPIDSGNFDLQYLEAFHTRDIGTSTPNTPLQFFNVAQQDFVCNLRQGLLGGNDDTGIIYSVGVSLTFGSVNATTGVVTPATNGYTQITFAAYETLMGGLNVLINHGELTILQRNRQKFKAKLSQCLAGSGINLQAAVGGGASAIGVVHNGQVGPPDPRARIILPDPLMLLPDLPISAEIRCAQAQAFGFTIAATVSLYGERIQPGGIGR